MSQECLVKGLTLKAQRPTLNAGLRNTLFPKKFIQFEIRDLAFSLKRLAFSIEKFISKTEIT